MKKNKKIVQNYEILQTLDDYENGYKILLAKHIETKQYHTIKKLSIKDGKNQILYNDLLNQVAILKHLNQQNIIKYYKMIKTSSTIYFVFNYLQGQTLAEILQQGPKTLNFSEKLSIAKQLCLVLSELQKKSIAHLSIDPDCIILSEDNIIQVTEFVYAIQIPEEGQIQLARKIPKSTFVSPELRKGLACHQADIFSIGKILQKMDFTQWHGSQQVAPARKRVEQILTMIDGMIEKQMLARLSMTQIYQILFKQKKKVKRLKSLQYTDDKSNYKSSKIYRMSSSVSSSKGLSNTTKPIFTEIISKILKFRNLSWFLIKCFKLVTVDICLTTQIQTILGMILLKKSTLILVNIGKYLNYGQNLLNLDIKSKDQAKFFKSADYYKIRELIDKEIQFQRKQWQQAIKTIYIHNSVLLKIPEFSKELKEDQFDDKYFVKLILQYIKVLLTKQQLLKQFARQKLIGLYLLSFIVYFKTAEQFFKQRILYQPVELSQQIFMKKVNSLRDDQIMANINANLTTDLLQI